MERTKYHIIFDQDDIRQMIEFHLLDDYNVEIPEQLEGYMIDALGEMTIKMQKQIWENIEPGDHLIAILSILAHYKHILLHKIIRLVEDGKDIKKWGVCSTDGTITMLQKPKPVPL